MNGALNTRAVITYQPILEGEVQALLKRLVAEPENFSESIRQ